MDIIPIETLLEAYAMGVFPMAPSRHSTEINWYTANKRGIIPIDQFHMSQNVKRLIRQHHFEVKYDTHFREVMKACADRETTWISDVIIESYSRLFELGYAHSVELYKNNHLAGGLYGVALRSAFFGESMFHYSKEMDKIALYYCHDKLKKGGFTLWDTQFYTEHLSQFGCIEISDNRYQILLKKALQSKALFI